MCVCVPERMCERAWLRTIIITWNCQTFIAIYYLSIDFKRFKFIKASYAYHMRKCLTTKLVTESRVCMASWALV